MWRWSQDVGGLHADAQPVHAISLMLSKLTMQHASFCKECSGVFFGWKEYHASKKRSVCDGTTFVELCDQHFYYEEVASSEDQIPAGNVATLGSLLEGKLVSMDAVTQLVAAFNTLFEGKPVNMASLNSTLLKGKPVNMAALNSFSKGTPVTGATGLLGGYPFNLAFVPNSPFTGSWGGLTPIGGGSVGTQLPSLIGHWALTTPVPPNMPVPYPVSVSKVDLSSPLQIQNLVSGGKPVDSLLGGLLGGGDGLSLSCLNNLLLNRLSGGEPVNVPGSSGLLAPLLNSLGPANNLC